MTLAKVSPGQRLQIPAEAYNAFIDAAVAYQGTRTSRQAEGGTSLPKVGVVTVRNDSGASQDRFAVLGIDVPLILPTVNAVAFQERVAFAVIAPDADLHADRFCILQEPLAAGALGRGLILGVSPVRLDVQAEDDQAATVVTDAAGFLTTGGTGAARILWKEVGTGERWGIVQIPAGGSDGGSPNLVLSVTQANHGWNLGDVLHWTSSAWVFADAGAVGTTDTLGVVGKVPDDNTALVVLWGILCLDGLQDHTDYWLDPAIPGGLTATKPDTAARLVLYHAENRLCVVRAGSAGSGGGGGAERFAELTDVDVTSTPPTDGQVPAWDAAAQRWRPTDAVLGKQPGTSVLANATGSSAKPTALAAATDGTALLRVGGTLQWIQVPTQALADHAVTSDKLADGSVSESKLQRDAVSTLTIQDGAVTTAKLDDHAVTADKLADGSVSEAKLQRDAVSTLTIRDGAVTTAKLAPGAVAEDQLADGAVSTDKIQVGAVDTLAIAAGAVTTDQIAADAVTTAELADGAVTNAKLDVDYLTIGGTDYHLGDEVDGLMTNPMTGSGDLVVGGTDGTPTRLPANAGGTLQVVASKNGITQLVPLTLDQMEDATIAMPIDGQVLTYEAATQQWTNKDPDDAGHGQHPAVVAKITAKSSGNRYNVILYPEYPSLAVAWITTATQLQGNTARTIPANTWTIACGVLQSGKPGTAAADYAFFIQVPVWM